jgi:hypothetical protein
MEPGASNMYLGEDFWFFQLHLGDGGDAAVDLSIENSDLSMASCSSRWAEEDLTRKRGRKEMRRSWRRSGGQRRRGIDPLWKRRRGGPVGVYHITGLISWACPDVAHS